MTNPLDMLWAGAGIGQLRVSRTKKHRRRVINRKGKTVTNYSKTKRASMIPHQIMVAPARGYKPVKGLVRPSFKIKRNKKTIDSMDGTWGELNAKGYKLPPMEDWDEDRTPNIADEAPLNPYKADWLPLYVSEGNAKLDRTIGVFSLPPDRCGKGILEGDGVVCKGASEDCKKFCYAKVAVRMYPSVLGSQLRNLYYSIYGMDKREQGGEYTSFEELVSGEINKFPAVRIHEAGDFYSPEYLKKWFTIASMNPDKQFTAYTKTFDLKGYTGLWKHEKPENFKLIQSRDESMIRAKRKYIEGEDIYHAGYEEPTDEKVELCKCGEGKKDYGCVPKGKKKCVTGDSVSKKACDSCMDRDKCGVRFVKIHGEESEKNKPVKVIEEYKGDLGVKKIEEER